MAGLLATSIGSGQLISRTGRYKVFPIIGTAIAAIGLLLLSGLDPDTGSLEAGVYMLVLGLGLGFVMQVLVLAVQNSVPYAQLGIATSSATLFRSIGGSLGTAILGAIFSNRLAHELASQLPARLGRRLGPHVRPGEPGSGRIAASRPARRLRALVHGFPLNRVRHRRGRGGRGVRARLDPGGAPAAQDDRGPRRR